MKENRYDDADFFARYSEIPRSREGLEAAGEWHTLRAMLPDFRGRRVLDLGCGFGWHCRYAAEGGAASVVGVDISEKMLDEARRATISPQIEYVRSPIEDFDCAPASFDVVISSLALHYVAAFGDVCHTVNRALVPGGAFVFSVEHPVFTARAPQEWHRDQQGNALHWPVDDYFSEGGRDMIFLGQKIVKYHRTLETYVRTLLECGFAIADLAEPKPSDAMLRDIPEMRDELRRPMMLIVSSVKK